MATFPDNKVPTSGNPGLSGGARMGGPVSPSDWSDMQYGFYTHRANTGKGGRHSGFDIAERDALTVELREFGMVYYCTSGANAGKAYVLSNSAMGGVDNDKTNNANWVELNILGPSFTLQVDRFEPITATDVSNGYLDLSQTPLTTMHLDVIRGGSVLDEGVGNDYTLSGNRITFTNGVLVDGDKVVVKYYY